MFGVPAMVRERLVEGQQSTNDGLKDVTFAILAGGLGTRLQPVIGDHPKVLAQVSGRPFLCYLLDQIEAAGGVGVVLCTGYRGGEVQATIGTTYGRLSLTYSHETAPLGTAGALRLAMPLFKPRVIAMNGDSYCPVNLAAVWAWHALSGARATLVMTEVPDTGRYGRIRFDADRRILEFVEKGMFHGRGWINAGIYCLERELLGSIPAGRSVSLERETFPAWIGRGLFGYPAHGQLMDIGTPEAYAVAERFLAEGGDVLRQNDTSPPLH